MAYSAGLMSPSRWPAFWSARATIPEKIGDASDVPPIRCQPGVLPNVQYTHAAPFTAALIEMSGVPRSVPTTPATPSWNDGRANTPDSAPPPAPYPSFQTTSGETRLPLLSSASWVPPTEVTSGSDDGHEFTR